MTLFLLCAWLVESNVDSNFFGSDWVLLLVGQRGSCMPDFFSEYTMFQNNVYVIMFQKKKLNVIYAFRKKL